jgi:hypothetical protein
MSRKVSKANIFQKRRFNVVVHKPYYRKYTQDNSYKNITRNYVLLVLTVIVALALVLAMAGYVLNDGILSKAHQGLSLITYPTEQQSSPQSSAPQSISAVPQTSIDFGTLEGKVLGPTGLPGFGASVIAQKELESLLP